MTRREFTFISDNGVRVFEPPTNSPYWVLRWTEDGVRRETTAGKTQEEALQRAKEIDKRLGHEHGHRSLRPAVEWLDEWLDPDRIRANGRTWSRKHYGETERRMNTHLRPQIQKLRAEQVRNKHLRAAIASAPTVGEKDAVLRNLRTFIKFGIARGWSTQDSNALLADLKESIIRPKRAFTAGTSTLYVDPRLRPSDEDVRTLSEAMAELPDAKWWYTLMPLLAAYSGLRLGEVLDLDVDDINLKEREITIDSQCLEARGYGKSRELPKYNTHRTTIFPTKTPWGYSLSNALRRRIKEAKSEPEFNYGDDDPRHLLFPAPGGGWWSHSNFGGRVRRPAQEIAGWPKNKEHEFIWNFHSLRHTFCSGLLQNGKSVVDIAVAAGHRNPNTTWQMYIGSGPDALKRLKA